MIRLFVRFANWLNARFPEKVVVTLHGYAALVDGIERLSTELSLIADRLGTLEASHAATVDRIARVESAAVHKGAVQELVQHVQEQKDELTALKVNLGWSKLAKNEPDISAILNGEPINHGE